MTNGKLTGQVYKQINKRFKQICTINNLTTGEFVNLSDRR